MENDKRRQILILGIGSEYRSDDRAGLHFARMIRTRVPASVTVKEHSGEGAALIDAWRGFETVLLIDAVSSGAPPGQVVIFHAAAENIPAKYFSYSSHAFGVAEAIKLARTLGTLPEDVLVYGIEGVNFGTGTRISPEVEHSLRQLVDQVLAELSSRSTN